ncbi:MAG: hypothetical protein GF364_17195 [Candidatus Lokiarchaeota archaeon]|nr:hypothetical protein [Candidatus Lokiarchaeota archaeon]
MNEEDIILPITWSGVLTLVRHGETNYNLENRFQGITDVSLNHKGKKQAKKSAKYLFDWSVKNNRYFDIILSSPLNRCIETAKEFEKLYEIEVIKEELLKERNYGVFEGLKHREAHEKYPDLFSDYQQDKPFISLPGGETAFDVEARMRDLLLHKIPEEYSMKKEILLVTHLNPIRAVFRLLGLANWDIYFKIFNSASINRIQIENNKAKFEFCDHCPLN